MFGNKKSKDDPLNELSTHKIKSIMVSPVITIYEDQSVSHALVMFLQKGLYYIPVINRSEKFVGLISLKYLYKTQSPRKLINPPLKYDPHIIIDGDTFYEKETLDSYFLRNIMYKKALTLSEDDTVAHAIQKMSKQNVSCIPILRDDQTVGGIITKQEIINVVAQMISSEK